MPNYRRYRVPGGSYFFTLKTENNAPLFKDDDRVRVLGDLMRQMQKIWPCAIDAIVLLPDHLHAIWTLPPGDFAYPTRWGWLKKESTKRHLAAGGAEQTLSESRTRNRRRGVWQRRYWEHAIQDDADFDAHFDYVHWNPVKHGYVSRVSDWPNSSFHRWVERGVYSIDWGGGHSPPESVARVGDAGE